MINLILQNKFRTSTQFQFSRELQPHYRRPFALRNIRIITSSLLHYSNKFKYNRCKVSSLPLYAEEYDDSNFKTFKVWNFGEDNSSFYFHRGHIFVSVNENYVAVERRGLNENIVRETPKTKGTPNDKVSYHTFDSIWSCFLNAYVLLVHL